MLIDEMESWKKKEIKEDAATKKEKKDKGRWPNMKKRKKKKKDFLLIFKKPLLSKYCSSVNNSVCKR